MTDRYDHSALDALLVRYRPDRLVLCDAAAGEQELLALVHRCKEFSLKVSLLPQLFSAMGPSVEVDDVEGVTVLGINPPVLPRSSRYLKRSMDMLVSAGVLLLLAPLMIADRARDQARLAAGPSSSGSGASARAVARFRCSSSGRWSSTPRPAAQELHGCTASDPGWLKLENDPRVTRVGRLLRAAQPRRAAPALERPAGRDEPRRPAAADRVRGRARSAAGPAAALDLTPGITGLWQVLGRTNIPFDEMVKLDYLYVTNWSLWTDIRLILRTFPAVLTRRGAN